MKLLSKSRKKRKESIDGWLFMLPVVILTLVFFIYPAIRAFYLSFFRYSIISTNPKFIGLYNYIALFYDNVFWRALLNTFLYAVVVVAVQLVIALMLALIANTKIRGKEFYRTAYYIPTLTSSVALVIIFIFLFKQNGVFNALIGLFGIQPITFFGNPLLALPGVMMMAIWASTGLYMIIFLGGLQGIPRSLYEAAEIDGASKWQQLLNVTIPQLKPTIFFNLVVSIIGCLQIFDLAFIVSGGNGGPLNSTMTVVLYIYNTGFKSFHMGYASAMAFVLFMIILILTLISKRLFKEETG